MGFDGLIQHLNAENDDKIHFIVSAHVGSAHRHLFTHLTTMDAQFIAGITSTKVLLRRVSAAREYGMYVIDLTHVKRKRRLGQLLQAVEAVKDGHRYTMSRRAGYKHWMVEKPKVVVFCRDAITQKLLGVAPEYELCKWQQWGCHLIYE